MIYRQAGEVFEHMTTIESQGASFDRVEYVDMDGSPGVEIVVGRKLSDQVIGSVSVYTFARGEADVLVATTVIEVGVDVPNATLMIIEDADRFGLSQLHQLRGRVGRGKDKSYCILTTHNRNEETLARLKSFCKTTDGFEIAREDLKMRGPGDFFGARQSGLPAFRMASLGTDLDTLTTAQNASKDWIEQYGTSDAPEAAALRKRIAALFERAEGTMN